MANDKLNPERISAISPALTDDLLRRSGTKAGIRLRRVVNHKLKSTPKEISAKVERRVVAAAYDRRIISVLQWFGARRAPLQDF
jgi:hypothetical protein